MNSYEQLVGVIELTAEEGCTLDMAEKTAALSLSVMNSLSEALKSCDRTRRFRKQGLKAIKSAVRLEEVKKYEKKPTEGALDDAVNMSDLVASEEKAFDDEEVAKEELERRYAIAKEAHVYYRGISKGRFEG